MYRSPLSNMFLLRYKLLDPVICEHIVFFISSIAMGRQELEKQRSWGLFKSFGWKDGEMVTCPAGPAPRMNVLSLSRSCWYSWYNTTVVKLWFPSTFDEFLGLWFWFCLFPLLLITMLMGSSWHQDPSNTSQLESSLYLRKIIFLAGYQQAMFHIYQLGNSR